MTEQETINVDRSSGIQLICWGLALALSVVMLILGLWNTDKAMIVLGLLAITVTHFELRVHLSSPSGGVETYE